MKSNPASMLTLLQSKLSPTNQSSDPDRSTSIEQSSGEEPSSTEENEANGDNNLNRRSNIDDSCNKGKLPKTNSRRPLNPNHLNFHRQLSQFRRTDTGEVETNSIPVRRLQHQQHRTRYNN